MAITQEFRDAVDSKKLIRVRIMLKDSMLVDPTLSQFEEMEKYANSKLLDLYDIHDGETLNFDISAWTDDYMNMQMVTVVNNFSKDRIDLLKNMVRHKYKERANTIRNSQNVSSTNNGITRKQVGIGMTTVGSVAAVAGICTSQGLLVAGGAVVAVAGIALIVTDK